MVAVSFYPALSAGFVLDDNIFTESRAVRAWSGLWSIWFSPADIEREGHYWPITYTSFWLEHKLWDITPFGTHLVNLLLYMFSVLLLWRLLRCLGVPGAWAVAAVFAVHPMHVDSVAWAIGRKDLLSGLFYMASALCWIRSVVGVDNGPGRSSGSTVIPHPGFYLAALGLFAAAMLSKSAAVTLPVAFAIWLWWKNARVTWTDVWRIAPFFLLALCIAVADLSYYKSTRELSFDYEPIERMLIAAHALWFYVGNLLWPTDLAVIYPLWDIDLGDPLAWGYLIAALALGALLWFGRHRLGRGPLAGAVFFAVTLSPVLGFVDFSHMRLSFVADRYAYLAGIGVIAVVVGGAAQGAARLPDLARMGVSVVLIAVLAVFGSLTWQQTGIYRDKITFYRHIISLNPGSETAYRNLAMALIDAGRGEEALAAGRILVDLFPDSARSHSTRGGALFALNRLDEAAESFQRALELDPKHRNTRQNMAETRREQTRFVESLRWYGSVLEIDPEFAPAHAGMGAALFGLGQYAQAVESLERAVSLRPDALPIDAFRLLGDAYRRQQRYVEAIETYRGILETDPEYAPAHAGIGYAMLQSRRHEEALESLAQAIALQPESPDAVDRHVSMGRSLEALGRTEAAEDHYADALEIDPRSATALDSFAVLRFRQQRYEEALGFYGTLIEIGEANAQVHANVGVALYNMGRREEALASLERALALDPDLEVARTGVETLRETLEEEQQ